MIKKNSSFLQGQIRWLESAIKSGTGTMSQAKDAQMAGKSIPELLTKYRSSSDASSREQKDLIKTVNTLMSKLDLLLKSQKR